MKLSISKIFRLNTLDSEERIQRVSLIRIILLTCFFGIPYSIIYITAFGIWAGSLVVGTYITLSFLNLGYFYFTNQYNTFRTIQLVLILLLPLSTQVALGGFMSSSAVGITSLLAPVGALMFHRVRVARIMFYLYLICLITAGLIEYFLLSQQTLVSREIQIMFFVFIMLAASIIIYFLLEYVVSQKNQSQAIVLAQNKDLLIKQDEISASNEELQQQREEMQALLDVVQGQNEVIKRNNEDLTASITYASRIQGVLLPTEQKMLDLFQQQFFVLYHPRDIVSGDFYWCEQVEDKIILAVGDCTGHGVPGAFMSMLAIAGLNSVIFQEKITSPELILNALHRYIYQSLRQDNKMNVDGMDILLVSIEPEQISFAGAMNSLFYLQKGVISEIKGDKKPIGGEQYGKVREYTKHHIPKLDSPTILYLSTDGYRDQFGGPQGKKLMKSTFVELLAKHHTHPFDTQKIILDTTIQEWMKESNESQVDDILVVGLCV